jgi:hypothetical protein
LQDAQLEMTDDKENDAMPKERGRIDRLRALLISEFSGVDKDLDAAIAEVEETESAAKVAIERSEELLRTLRR